MSTVTRVDDVQARAEVLRDLVATTERLTPSLRRAAAAELDALTERLALGAGHVVVALVGGTGSGKSSLFNALTALTVADVGARRPTTSVPAAAAWGSDATALLDHLGVPENRRTRGELALGGPDPARLPGVVLLDVPDHDSVEQGHRDQVDRLVPLVDLLVWVLDPQKYADHRLHAEYLAGLRDRQGAMLAVVNQADTITPAGLEAVRQDVTRLLAADGLDEVEVLTASARTGDGIDALCERLYGVAAEPSHAERTVRSRLAAVTAELGADLGERPPPPPDDDEAAQRLGAILGVPAVGDAVAATMRGQGVEVRQLRRPAPARLAAFREWWLERGTAGVAQPWSQYVTEAFPDDEELVAAAVRAVEALETEARPPSAWARLAPGRLAKAGDDARSQYLERAHAALAGVLTDQLGPAREALAELTVLRETLAG